MSSIVKQDRNNIEKQYDQPNANLIAYCNDIESIENLMQFVPVGTVASYIPHNLSWNIGQINNFLSDYNFKVCDGSLYNNADSPIYNGAGRYLPNLTDDIFLMGSTTMGTPGGSNTMEDHRHNYSLTTNAVSYVGRGTLSIHNHTGTHSYQTPAVEHNHDHRISCSQELDLDYCYVARFPNMYASGTASAYGYLHHTTHTHANWTATIKGDTTVGETRHGAIKINHSHIIDFSTGTIGVGNIPTDTDNKPKFLRVYFIQKVQYNIY